MFLLRKFLPGRQLLGGGLTLALLAAITAGAQPAEALLPTVDDYYKIVTLPIPEGVVLEGGGVVMLPNGNLAVSTRRGEVWIVENPTSDRPYYRRFAHGLHEILGLYYQDGDLYMAQRGELTKLRDTNGDGTADLYETVYAWPLSGHYHEYSFGPVTDPAGHMFVTGNVAFGDREWWRGESRVPWRGWTMEINPTTGQMQPYATGMRSPCGLGMVDGEFFYTDNQGDWMGSGGVVHVEKGDFTGHPGGLRWTSRPESPLKLTTQELYAVVDPRMTPEGEEPIKPENDANDPGTPLFEVAEQLPAVKVPAVWLPHSILGISTSEIKVDSTGGQFGPFEGQLFVGDQGQSKIDRVFLEKVNGVYQGAAFPFREAFASGVLRMGWGHDGSMYVGQTNRGWGSTGPLPYALQRVVWTGKTPFEMKAIRAMPDGFEVEFTQQVDKRTAADPDNYNVTGFIYKYQPVYGSPVINDAPCLVQGVVVSDDGRRARLVVDNLRPHYIHEVRVEGVRSRGEALPLLHNTGYYTLNEIPAGEKLNLPKRTVAARPAAGHAGHTMATTKTTTPDDPAGAKAAPKAPATRAAKNPAAKPAGWSKPDHVLVVGTEPGLKYDVKAITVKAGSKVQLTFSNNDDMPHNLVVVKPGQAIAVGQEAMKLGLKGQEMNYVPNDGDVLFFTRLLAPGTDETLYLTAPTTPGTYTYVCTVPGHFYVMQGTLNVVR